MNDSLSIIVPVRNAETTLADQLTLLLEVAADLTGWFEIVVIDDGSSDQTVDVVRGLASQYPQLRLIRHREPRGTEATVRTGLQWVQGQTVFVQENASSLSPMDLRRLWSMRHDEQLVMARAGVRRGIFDERLLERLTQWGQALKQLSEQESVTGGIHMIRRGAVQELLADHDGEEKISLAHVPAVAPVRADASHAALASRPPATFLRHLKNLALGE